MGCQRQPEILFENINVGDNIETCLAKGAIQYFYDDEYAFKLANDNIATSYFHTNTVKFNEHKIVEEIYCFYYMKDDKNKSAAEVFSSMTQYFCQRYKGMKTEKVNEKRYDNNQIEYNFSATTNIWETNKIRVELMFYTQTIDSEVYNRYLQPYANEKHDWIISGHSTSYWLAKSTLDEIEGKYVSLTIVSK